MTFKDLDDLNLLIGRVNTWKAQVGAFLDQQTVREQMRKRLKFKNLLNEAKQLKLGGPEMPQVARLQRRFDYVEWREQVNAFWRRALRDNQAVLGTDEQLVGEIVEEDDSEKSSSEESSDGSEASECQSDRIGED